MPRIAMMSCKILVALQNFLHAARDGVMLFADNFGRERFRGRSERIDRRINAQLRDRAFEHDGRIKMRKGVRRRRIGQIVRRNVNRLERSDRAFLGRSDAFLQIAHLGRERRLITDRGRRSAEQSRHFRARLRKAKDVVDEERARPGCVRRGNIPSSPARRARRADARPAARSSVRKRARLSICSGLSGR